MVFRPFYLKNSDYFVSKKFAVLKKFWRKNKNFTFVPSIPKDQKSIALPN